MQQPPPIGEPTSSAPRFYLTGRQPLHPGTILFAILTAVVGLSSVVYAMGHNGKMFVSSGSRDSRSAGATSAPTDDDDDDPSKTDTIVLGDPADAPVPGKRGDHVSPVHPTILVSLPRFGKETGLIPDTPAGHLLYGWLAAFNQANYPALGNALPNVALGPAAAAQMDLRRHTGGFNLLSAKEVMPGVLVFRLRDQTPEGTESLGTLQMRPNSNPASIASFSVRAVPSPRQESTTDVAQPFAPAPQ